MSVLTRGKKAAAGAAIVVLVSLFGAGWYFSSQVITPKMKAYDETYRMEVEAGKIIERDFKALPKEVFYVESPFGYRLHGLYIPASGSKKTVIIAHGITYTLMGSMKYVNIFRGRGFNVLVYDHRHHGRSGGDNVTFGVYEKHDMKAVMDWALAKAGPDSIVGVHGESMGAGIALEYAAMDDRAAFVIADCPYSDLTELLSFRLKADFGLPAFPMLPVASMVSKLRGGMFFSEVSPVRTIGSVRAPVFFIHGADDVYIPPAMSKKMYEMKKGPKKLYLAPAAGHAMAFWNNRKEYDLKVGEFLAEIGIR
jgi:fermentation-respiration switch protein FrsA (DUF1100 family)